MRARWLANENIGWIAGENGSMVKTEDGGKTWFSLPLDSIWQFDMIDFVNDSVGWAIGWEKNKGKMIFKTKDGGWTWDIKHENIENYLNAIYAVIASLAMLDMQRFLRPKMVVMFGQTLHQILNVNFSLSGSGIPMLASLPVFTMKTKK